MQQNPCDIVIEGLLSIYAALQSGVRDLEVIWIDEEKRREPSLGSLQAQARDRGVAVKFVPGEEIAPHLRGKTSGGVIAFASERRFLAVPDLLRTVPKGRWVALEGFEDPYNYGDAVRSLYAAGFDGLLTSRKSWNKADAVVLRASAGAAERVPTALIEDYPEAVAALQGADVRILCAEKAKEAVSLYACRAEPPYLMVIGGEKRGIAKPLLRAADQLVAIPYGRHVPYALSGASAAAVIAFELARQAT